MGPPGVGRSLLQPARRPRYNRSRGRTFLIEHWRAVTRVAGDYATAAGIPGVKAWADIAGAKTSVPKADQDRLDAVLCALIGYHSRFKLRPASVMIGDLETGYMISPASAATRERLERAAAVRGVPLDGHIPSSVKSG